MPVYSREYTKINTPERYHTRTGMVGTKDDRLRNNPYSRRLATSSNGTWFPANEYASKSGFTTNQLTSVHNRAISKFRDELGAKASNLTALMEVNKSLQMITSRGLQLAKAARELKQLRLADAARTLAIPEDVKRDVIGRASKKHLFSGMWLEYWLGWAPMIGDIYTSVDVLQRPFPTDMIEVRATDTKPIQLGLVQREWFVDRYINRYYSYQTGTVKCNVGLYGEIEILNSNLFLASQLGLTNPALTAWDLVPFSFVVNWFTPVSSFLAGMDLAPGMRINRGGRTYKFIHSSKVLHSQLEVYGCTPSGHNCKGRVTVQEGTIKSVDFTRQPGAHPSFRLTPPRIPKMSVSRAATSISLLTQLFLKP